MRAVATNLFTVLWFTVLNMRPGMSAIYFVFLDLGGHLAAQSQAYTLPAFVPSFLRA
jgi:hypothetical protein